MNLGVSRGIAQVGSIDELDVAAAPSDGPVAVGGTLEPNQLLIAYQRGLFPFPSGSRAAAELNSFKYAPAVAAGATMQLPGGDAWSLTWWSPDPRWVIVVERIRRPSSLVRRRQKIGHWRTTVDHAFERTLHACAQGRRDNWMTDELRRSMTRLHLEGHAHSLEVWDGEELVGGLVGVALNKVFVVDSAFNVRDDAAKVALLDLCTRRLASTTTELLDVQWPGGLASTMGAEAIGRTRYLDLLEGPLDSFRLLSEALAVSDLLNG